MDGYALGHYPLSPTVRRRVALCAGCGLILALLFVATVCCAATYRWVDERGKVHYGDSIPPQYAGQGHTELNKQGRVIKQVEPTPNAASLRARQEREEAEKQADRDRRRRDNALLATYANTSEIDTAQRRALEQEQSLLASLEAMRKHSSSPSEADHIDSMILQRHKAMDDIRARFDSDKARYIELKGGR